MTKLYNMLLLDKVYRCQFCIVDLWCCWIQLFKLIYFNWRLTTLQYWGGFCHTSHESARDAHVSPILKPHPAPSPPHPSGLSQSTSFGCSASCIELALVIYFRYGNIHVSVVISHIVPSSSSPIESKSLFFTSVSVLLSCI